MSASTIPLRGRALQGRPAGVVSRLSAALLDLAVVAAGTAAVLFGWSIATFLLSRGSYRAPHPGPEGTFALGAALAVLYLWSGWSGTGRTIGARTLGLRVLHKDGSKVGTTRAFVRALVCVAFPVGLLWCAISAHRRSVADVLTDTAVVYDWRRHPSSPKTDTHSSPSD